MGNAERRSLKGSDRGSSGRASRWAAQTNREESAETWRRQPEGQMFGGSHADLDATLGGRPDGRTDGNAWRTMAGRSRLCHPWSILWRRCIYIWAILERGFRQTITGNVRRTTEKFGCVLGGGTPMSLSSQDSASTTLVGATKPL